MKIKDSEGNYSSMNVGELKKMIKEVPNELDVYIRVCHNPTGNIVEAGIAIESFSIFFGDKIPCIIIEPSYSDYAKK